MKLTITIDLNNAAFDNDREATKQEGSMFETSRILDLLARRFAAGSWPMEGPIMDANGNTCGQVELEP